MIRQLAIICTYVFLSTTARAAEEANKARILLFNPQAPKARPELYLYEALPKDFTEVPIFATELKEVGSEKTISNEAAAEEQKPVETKVEMQEEPKKQEPAKKSKAKKKKKQPDPPEANAQT